MAVECKINFEEKMKQSLKCPLCYEEVYSGLGEGCKMCGMAIEKNKDFCSKKCEEKYNKINYIVKNKINSRDIFPLK